MNMRKDWNSYFMDIARMVATRATCDRKHVGAVIVRDRSILSTGYNGALQGQPHCDEIGHMMEDGHCVRTNHAEANAIIQAAKHGVSIDGGTIYTTASPCWPCFRLIAGSGLKCIVFGELYRDERITNFAEASKIKLTWLRGDKPPVVVGPNTPFPD
jgi:dCMP deaminase